MTNKVVYIGTQEADAFGFRELATRDFPSLELVATNDRHEAMSCLSDAEGIIAHYFQFDEAMLNSAVQLRWIQSLTTGTDAILRLPNLRSDVIVTSTRGMHGPQMSELVFLQMIALLRRFPTIQRNQREKRWERWPQPLLLNKTIVIVGVGKIAEALAIRCKCFGMTVYGVSQSPRIPPGFDGVYARVQLATAASKADFLVLVVPYSTETENLVDKEVIDAMKPTAYLINVARGGVLAEGDLLRAVRTGQIAGAALDVFRQTPLPPEAPFWEEERILITPTLGGMSDIYLDQAYPIVRANLACFLKGDLHSMQNVVTH